MAGNRGRGSLTQALDREVYPAVQRYLESAGPQDKRKLAVLGPRIQEYIRNSNSSLARRPKKQLEESIERVLRVLESERKEQDFLDLEPVDESREGSDLAKPSTSAVDRSLNQRMIAGWATNRRELQGSPRAMDAPTQEASESSTRRAKRLTSNGESPLKRRRADAIDYSPPSRDLIKDIGGLDDIIDKIVKLFCRPLFQLPDSQGTETISTLGLLLHGPTGCGKTMLASAIAGLLEVSFISVSPTSIIAGISGESEKHLRQRFEEAKSQAPCILFIDEIDLLAPKRENTSREMDRRIAGQLGLCMDSLALGPGNVVVMAATTKPDNIDAAIRRGGRLDVEIQVPVPNESAREAILKSAFRSLTRAEVSADLQVLARATPGFVGADLRQVVNAAVAIADRRTIDQLQPQPASGDLEDRLTAISQLDHTISIIQAAREFYRSPRRISITTQDCLQALSEVQPSAKREGFATIPKTTWDEVGALQAVRERLCQVMVEPILHPERFARVGLSTAGGVVLWGPPGCGKTLLAKAVANASSANFISVKGPELLDKYVGESERAVRQLFTRARASAPCIVFIDEVDGLAPQRDRSGSEVSMRVVNTLLTELDGIEDRQQIYVIAATNRLDVVDSAILRPGRFDQTIFVDLPRADERVEILRTLLRNTGIQWIEGLEELARECEGFSGADLGAVMKSAGMNAVYRNDSIRLLDFTTARQSLRPSVHNHADYLEMHERWD